MLSFNMHIFILQNNPIVIMFVYPSVKKRKPTEKYKICFSTIYTNRLSH